MYINCLEHADITEIAGLIECVTQVLDFYPHLYFNAVQKIPTRYEIYINHMYVLFLSYLNEVTFAKIIVIGLLKLLQS